MRISVPHFLVPELSLRHFYLWSLDECWCRITKFDTVRICPRDGKFRFWSLYELDSFCQNIPVLIKKEASER
jgi:hypothetical protein